MIRQPATAAPGSAKALIALLLAALAALAAFSPVLYGPLEFNGDDYLYIVENPFVQDLSLSSLRRIWTTPTKFEYFPVLITSFAVDSALWGQSPRLFHIVNLALFLAAGWAVFAIAMRLCTGEAAECGRWTAAAAAAIFILHPANVESAASIANRKELLYAVFGLFSLLAYICARRPAGYALALALMVMSQLSKGTAVMLPFVFSAWELLCVQRREPGRALLRLAPAFAIAGVIFLYQFGVAQGSGVVDSGAHVTAASRAGGVLTTASAALKGLLLPVGLTYEYDIKWPSGTAWPAAWALPAALAVAMALLAWKGMRKELMLAVAGALAFVPYSNIVPLKHVVEGNMVYYDHYLLFTLAPASVLAARLGARVKGRGARGALLVVFICALAACAAYDYRLASVWKTKESLYSYLAERSPGIARPHLFLGEAYLEQGRYEEALELFRKGSSLGQKLPDEYHRWVGDANAFSGRYEEAVSEYRADLERRGYNKGTMQNLSSSLIMLGRRDEARAVVSAILAREPADATALGNLRLIEGAAAEDARPD